ncbi:MAG: transcriptional regulator NrdR [Cyanobacteria bacterium J06560_2]
MQCPFCQHPNNRVLESRSAEGDRSIRRRRECLDCERRFTTYERIEYVPVTVIKRGGERESFDRSKLLRGIVTACEKTGVSARTVEMMVDELEAELQQQAVREVTSENIGERVLQRLQQVSEVAYVRFASVYRQFQGIRDFTEALSHLEGQGDKAMLDSTDERIRHDSGRAGAIGEPMARPTAPKKTENSLSSASKSGKSTSQVASSVKA